MLAKDIQPGKPVRLILLFTLLMFITSILLPQSTVVAMPNYLPETGEEEIGNGYSMTERDFKRLRVLYSRYKDKVKPLVKGLEKLGQNYAILRDRGDKRWIKMRFLCYDYHSYYQSAVSHQYEIELLLENHPGFNDKGKITNKAAASLTVYKLRGAVVQMITSINKAEKKLKEGNKFMRSCAVQDKKPNKD